MIELTQTFSDSPTEYNFKTTKMAQGLQDLTNTGYYAFVGSTYSAYINIYGGYFDPEEVARHNPSDYKEVYLVRLPTSDESYEYMLREIRDPLNSNPWRYQAWFRENVHRWIEMLPRPSEKEPGLLSYFQTPEKRAANIRTPIKPGRWLSKYFSDLLTQPEIQEAAREWDAKYALRVAKITQDADEIEAVYTGRHHGSCMWFPHEDYSGPCHPARVYAGPDLGIAYIGEKDSCDARVLVWPEKKIWYDNAVYGDSSRLRDSLTHLGYTAASSYKFEGARIRRIRSGSRFVLPYIDVADTVEDYGDYLVLREGNINCRCTSGVSGHEYRCDDCEDGMDEDEAHYTANDSHVCTHCLDRYYFHCQVKEEYYPNDQRADTPSEYYVCKDVAKGPEWFYCEATELYYPKEDYDCVETFEEETVDLGHVEANGFFCIKSQKYSLEVINEVVLPDGKSVHRNAFETEADFDAFVSLHQPDQIWLPIELEAA